jgi:hypothetical protein
MQSSMNVSAEDDIAYIKLLKLNIINQNNEINRDPIRS